MRLRRRLAAVPFLLLALAACSDDAAPEPTAAPEDSASVPAITGEGRGGTELPSVEDQQGALGAAGDATEVLAAPLAEGATETAQVAEATAGPHLLRVACTSKDGAPVIVTVTAAGAELTSYQAPCTPVFQGGTTVADSDPFDVPAGALDVSVVAATEAVVAVGLVAAG
ncbi:hypothetical protein [Cellulomonas sp. S1-8]|uniref:hypothetical protein n=1 Tax=Cellulomonas sp. S1-8 TaxID=2904790 RepID=UPI0022436958|nr:hypothetical protein [Cellulomonas sp. S1-8]UZN02642.1 hypothetical protein OKX07_16535 [Cellulomonas sp. S1-8]